MVCETALLRRKIKLFRKTASPQTLTPPSKCHELTDHNFFEPILGLLTIAYQGLKFWNTLPAELKDESSKNVGFEKNLHRFLVQQVNRFHIVD